MTKTHPDLIGAIRDIPDFPKKGIIFKDITTLLTRGDLFRKVIDEFAAYYEGKGIQKIVGIESRGFIFGSALAYKLGAGIVPVRKKGKLPHKTVTATYQLEYGTDTLEMHADALDGGADRVLVVDDLLATGGTMKACCDLVKELGGAIAGVACLIELAGLKGRERVAPHQVHAVLRYH